MKLRILTLAVAALLVGCGAKKQKKEEKAPVTTEVQAQKQQETVTLEIAGTDQMQFDKAELKVKAGQKVTLVFKHAGTMPKDAMGHNWVLLKQGTDIPAFAEKAMAAKDTDYIPESDAVIAHTKLIGGGETDTITFDAPEKGTYDFICSFPGHYAMMKGQFIVE